jgi:DNA-binding transcriptional MocR family regulator
MRQFPASPITALIDESPDVNLSESIGPDLSVADILGQDGQDGQDGLAALAGVSLGYGTSAGHPDLRALVAGRLGVPSEQVLLTSGAAGALFLVALLHSDSEGDGEVVACLPCYPPMLDVLRGLGAPVVTVSGRFEDGYRIDLDAFSDRLSARTRLVMVASPQNPSGCRSRRRRPTGCSPPWPAAAPRRCCWWTRPSGRPRTAAPRPRRAARPGRSGC